MVQLAVTPPPGPLLDEEDMPESTLHDQAIVLLQFILVAWAERTGLDALVARNLACRWLQSDARIGIDPDLLLTVPHPPLPAGRHSLKQLRLWEPGHEPTRVTVEVVSEFTPTNDYVDAPRDHAMAGVSELWVFDPELHGPTAGGGPFRLQVFRRQGPGALQRVHAGDGPAWSEQVQGWLVLTDEGRRLRIADDRAGVHLWPTEAEAAEQARQREQTARQREQAARQQAEAERQREQAARQQAEEARQRAEAAQQRAEAEVVELRKMLADLEARGRS